MSNDRELLKEWSNQFFKDFSRQPNKEDFKQAPPEVQEAGTRYQKSKSTPVLKPKNLNIKTGFSLNSKNKSSIGAKIALKSAIKRKRDDDDDNNKTILEQEDKENIDNLENKRFAHDEVECFNSLPKKTTKTKFTAGNLFKDSNSTFENLNPIEEEKTLEDDFSPYSNSSSVAISPFHFQPGSNQSSKPIYDCHKSPKKSRPNLQNSSKKIDTHQSQMTKLFSVDSTFNSKFDNLIKSPARKLIGDQNLDSDEETTIKAKNRKEPIKLLKDSKKSAASKTVSSVPTKNPKQTSSTLTNNFIRLDLKKKVYLKGANNAKKLQRSVYKEKLNKKFGGSLNKNFSSSSSGKSYVNPKWGNTSEAKCFKCGLPGHRAADCNQVKKLPDKVLENLRKDFNPDELEQINVKIDEILKRTDSEKYDNFECETEISISESRKIIQEKTHFKTQNKKVFEEEDIFQGLNHFGFDSFKDGQYDAISSILIDQRNTLVVLPTGQGKSLTFQIPALLLYQKFKFLTLVISPLVSLMDDQVKGLPKMLPACRINSSMNEKQKSKTLEDLANNKYAILYISPEALNSWCSNPDSSFLKSMPAIGLAVIDEIHCLSQWSHSFRPSYLRVCSILKRLYVPVIMGLTATATDETCKEVIGHLDTNTNYDNQQFKQSSEQKCFLLRKVNIPKNIIVSCCQIENSDRNTKDDHLVEVLKSFRFKELNSIIIYCTRREECERLKTTLEIEDLEGRTIEVYHAGLTPSKRKKVQKDFMSEKINIMIATVAFGMGIDKQDVRSVIHYNLPKNFESYVQEIGRSGRDGKLSYCHLIFAEEDLQELSRFAYANYIDRNTIRKLILKYLVPYHCQCQVGKCVGHENSLNLDLAVAELDITKESIETLVSYLENEVQEKIDSFDQYRSRLVTATRSVINADITIKCYNGPKQLSLLSQKCPPIAVAIGSLNKHDRPNFNTDTEFTFNAITVADRINSDVYTLRRKIRQITWDPTMLPGYDANTSKINQNDAVKTGISIEYSKLSLWFRSVKLNHDLLDQKIEYLYSRVIKQIKRELKQLYLFFYTTKKFAFVKSEYCDPKINNPKSLSQRSSAFKAIIDKYFNTEDFSKELQEEKIEISTDNFTSSGQSNDEAFRLARQLFNQHGLEQGDLLTPRSIANILYGINSPCFPAYVWARQKGFWRQGLHLKFMDILTSANEAYVEYKLR